MINRRVSRPSRPTESLRQMVLNSSAGVSCIKAPTDSRSVLYSKNLVTNPDGSVSIRKPLIISKSFVNTIVKVIPLNVNDASLVLVRDTVDGPTYVRILNATLESVPYKLIWYDMHGDEHTHRVPNSDGGPFDSRLTSEILNLENCDWTFTSTTVLLNNCMLKTDAGNASYRFPGEPTVYKNGSPYFADVPVHDITLYTEYDPSDDSTVLNVTNEVPRCVQVYYVNDLEGWCIRIPPLDPNNYVSTELSDGKVQVSHPVNTMLLNPYAVRDRYGATAPYVHTVREYVRTTESDGKIVPIEPVFSTNTSTTELIRQKYVSKSTRIADVSTELELQTEVYSFEHNQDGSIFHHYTYTYTGHLYSGNTLTNDAYTGISDLTVDVEVVLRFTHHQVSPGGSDSGDTFKITVLSTSCNYLAAKMLRIDPDFATHSYLDKDNFTVTLPWVSCKLKHSILGGTNGAHPVDHISIVQSDADFEKTTWAPFGGLGPFKKADIEDWAGMGSIGSDVTDWTYNVAFNELTKISKDDFGWFKSLTPVFKISFTNPTLNQSPILRSIISYDEKYSETTSTTSLDTTIARLTESTASTRFRASVGSSFAPRSKVLKAFIDIPKDMLGNFSTPTSNKTYLYGTWAYTVDGISWKDALAHRFENVTPGSYNVTVEAPEYDPVFSLEGTVDEEESVTFRCVPINASSPYTDTASERGDCLILSTADTPEEILNALAYQFRLYAVRWGDNTVADPTTTLCGMQLLYRTELAADLFEDFDAGSSCKGNVFYKNSRILFYGTDELHNYVFYTYPDELATPISNTIILDTHSSERPTRLITWRNSIITFTDRAIYKSDPIENGDGFLTKTVNPTIGTTYGKCCVPVLNGIIFKSGTKVYQLYPNVYSDNDTVLNITDISKDIAHYLEEYDSTEAFAFSTSTEYVLMLPQDSTTCLRYNYETHLWTVHEYPAKFLFAITKDSQNVKLYGTVQGYSNLCEFAFDADVTDIDVPRADELPYGDVLTVTLPTEPGQFGVGIEAVKTALDAYFATIPENNITPIEFELDSGQKTDSISTTRQFVESKLVFATAHEDDSFPISVTVHVDGDPHVITRDLSTDSSFGKSEAVRGVLNTTFNGLTTSSDTLGTLRQFIIRYSGKGKSIRHIISGKSFRNFKFYETSVRYKTLNIKQ